MPQWGVTQSGGPEKVDRGERFFDASGGQNSVFYINVSLQ